MIPKCNAINSLVNVERKKLSHFSVQILTALDRDGYCRKHKLRHKLEQAINLMSGSSWGRRMERGVRGRVERGGGVGWTGEWTCVGTSTACASKNEDIRDTGQSTQGTTAQHIKPNVYWPDSVPNILTPSNLYLPLPVKHSESFFSPHWPFQWQTL